MKVFISFDMEGVAGIVDWSQCRAPGRHKPLYMMQGLDATADLVFMVGYHGSISGESSVLSHTYNPAVVSHVELNGVRVGESGINALVALAYQAPVGLITGDQQTIAEADPFLPDAERVVVKESITRFGAVNLHPEVAREMIAAGARRAVERAAAEPSEVWEIAAGASGDS